MYRPVLHYTSRKNWMSDPNGCIYLNGVYHLYYQHNPQSCSWGDMYWGHAVSEDLLNWEEREVVLYPHPDTGLPFSGTAVLDAANSSGLFPETGTQDNVVLVYTGHIPKSFSGTSAREQQCIAYCLDAGASFVPYRENPVVSSNSRSDFRDPKVFWHAGTRSWVMLVTASETLEFYRSENLRDWELASKFTPELACTFKNLECPDMILVPLEEQPEIRIWMISVCIQYEEPTDIQAATIYFIGDFDGFSFSQKEGPRQVDHGTEFYAMQSWSNAPEGVCRWIGWVRDWLKDRFFTESTWRGVMSIPRDLQLRKNSQGGHDLIQTPCLEAIEESLISTDLSGKVQTQLDPNKAYIIDIGRAGNARDGWCHISLLSENGDEITIDYTDTHQQLFVEKSYKDTEICKISHESKSIELDRDRFDLQIIIDSAIIEIFAEKGRVLFSHSWYAPSDAREIEIRLSPGTLKGSLQETRDSSMVALRGEHIGINQG